MDVHITQMTYVRSRASLKVAMSESILGSVYGSPCSINHCHVSCRYLCLKPRKFWHMWCVLSYQVTRSYGDLSLCQNNDWISGLRRRCLGSAGREMSNVVNEKILNVMSIPDITASNTAPLILQYHFTFFHPITSLCLPLPSVFTSET